MFGSVFRALTKPTKPPTLTVEMITPPEKVITTSEGVSLIKGFLREHAGYSAKDAQLAATDFKHDMDGDDEILRDELACANDDLKDAREDLIAARSDLVNAKKMVKLGTLSEDELSAAQDEVDSAARRLEECKEEVAGCKAAIDAAKDRRHAVVRFVNGLFD